MTDTDIIQKAQSYLKLALPLMSKHLVPITPRNYDVWYQYVSGGNSELTDRIDGILKAKEPFTEATNEMLYQSFCAEANEDELNKLREDLQNLLATVMVEFSSMSGKTNDYTAALTDSTAKVSEDMSVDAFKAVIDEIIDETKSINRFSRDMQQQLENTTEELEHLQKEFERTKQEASIDFLTGVANRKFLKEKMDLLTQVAVEDDKLLSILVIDIDHFKRFNDEHGHLVGDEVLKFVSKKIKENVRGKDFIARYGGEEFVVLLPVTPLKGASILAENIRRFFSETTLKLAGTSKKLGHITVSIGVAEYRPGEPPSEWIERADKALYQAKNTGRNRVVAESEL